MDREERDRDEAELFRALNLVVEPLTRAGVLGAPGPCWAGPIVVETRGRRTGRVLRIPLLAAPLGPFLVVATVRGRRSQWVKNLRAHPYVRIWVGGHAWEATAFVIHSSRAQPETRSLPASVRCLAASLAPWAGQFNLEFAVLSPGLPMAGHDVT